MSADKSVSIKLQRTSGKSLLHHPPRARHALLEAVRLACTQAAHLELTRRPPPPVATCTAGSSSSQPQRAAAIRMRAALHAASRMRTAPIDSHHCNLSEDAFVLCLCNLTQSFQQLSASIRTHVHTAATRRSADLRCVALPVARTMVETVKLQAL
jgi:hypothetical protein